MLEVKPMSETESELLNKKKGIYLLPNLFTTAGLFSGFYAVVAAMKGDFEIAAIALFVAMIMDGLDGRVARLTNTQSAFGAQYDSLSDMVCFGLTPALVVYSWGLQYLGKLGWLAAFVYAAATGLRLARFNIQPETASKYFIGLPCPPAAAVIASLVWIGTDFGIPGKRFSEIAALITVAVAILMVSNVKYHSFKEIDLKENVPFFTVLVVVLLLVLVAFDPPKILFSVFFIFMLSGPILYLKNRFFSKNKTDIQPDNFNKKDLKILTKAESLKKKGSPDSSGSSEIEIN